MKFSICEEFICEIDFTEKIHFDFMNTLISQVFLQGNGVAIATKVGKVLIVVFVWKHVAMMDMTMIKVKQIKNFFCEKNSSNIL